MYPSDCDRRGHLAGINDLRSDRDVLFGVHKRVSRWNVCTMIPFVTCGGVDSQRWSALLPLKIRLIGKK